MLSTGIQELLFPHLLISDATGQQASKEIGSEKDKAMAHGHPAAG